VRDLRRDVTVPMVFMTYANVVFSYGTQRFLSACSEAGIDGLILPDLPFEEKEEFLPDCRRYGVALISLIAPTSEKRIAMIAREAEGFVYLVSSLGVTGTRSEITTDLAAIVRVIRENTSVPCAIGFGISTPSISGMSSTSNFLPPGFPFAAFSFTAVFLRPAPGLAPPRPPMLFDFVGICHHLPLLPF